MENIGAVMQSIWMGTFLLIHAIIQELVVKGRQ